MKVISVVNQKGGCGKTITAVNLSAALAKIGQRVLLIDLDPQAHATFSLRKGNNFTITEALEKICQDKELSQEAIFVPVSDNLYFLPSSIGLASLEHKFSQREDKLRILSHFLKTLTANFDFCILDCPPNLGIITLNALEASKYSLIPLSVCDFSLRGIEILKEIFIMLKEFKGDTPIPFYLLTQFEKRSRFSREFLERIKNQLGNLLLNTIIRTNTHLREAVLKGKNIFEHKPDSRGAEDFTSLAKEVQKITSQTKWASLFLKGTNFSEVYVVGDFNGWQKNQNYKLKRVGQDIWNINLPLEKGEYSYKFLAGETWLTDPYNKLAKADPFGGKNSLLLVE